MPGSPAAAVVHELPTLRDRVALALAAAAREHHLVERAVRDSLTGLLNRNGLHDACDRRLAAGRSAAVPAAAAAAPFNVLLVDLDGFKEVNDTLGHAVGDAVLRAVADRLHGALPAGATLARAGGDEFVVLHEGTADEAERLAEALCSLAARPIAHREHVVQLGASVGIASLGETRSGPDTTGNEPALERDAAAERDELLRRADVAMYAAKTAGRGWRRYVDTMDAEAIERAWITRELRRALDQGALEVHYQPRVDPRDGHVSSSEALVRWTHAERGPISPTRFVPVAEDNGLIGRLGSFVLDAALARAAAGATRARRAGASPSTSRRASCATKVRRRHPRRARAARPGPGGAGTRDHREPLRRRRGERAARAAALRERGVWVALDDFGTGFSSAGGAAEPADRRAEDRPQLRHRPRRARERAGRGALGDRAGAGAGQARRRRRRGDGRAGAAPARARLRRVPGLPLCAAAGAGAVRGARAGGVRAGARGAASAHGAGDAPDPGGRRGHSAARRPHPGLSAGQRHRGRGATAAAPLAGTAPAPRPHRR
ncbi:MAG: diguanylate cyclase [Rubrivivax sp.]